MSWVKVLIILVVLPNLPFSPNTLKKLHIKKISTTTKIRQVLRYVSRYVSQYKPAYLLVVSVYLPLARMASISAYPQA
jgi:hypothetical protein